MGHVFISYSHKDTRYAHKLSDALTEMGFNVWIDERLDYGSQWPLEIQKQLDTCDAFILLMTPNSFESEWVQSELQRAKRKLKPIFPLLLKGDEPWLSVESTQYYDVRGERFPDKKFYSALKRVVSVGTSSSTLEFSKKAIQDRPVQPSAPKFSAGMGFLAVSVLVVVFVACAGIAFGLRFLIPSSPTATRESSQVIQPTLFVSTDTPFAVVSNTAVEVSPVLDATITPRPTDTVIPPTATFTKTPVPPTFTPSATATPKRDTSFYIEAENGKVGNGAYVDTESTASQSSLVNFNVAGTVKFTLKNVKAGQYSVVIHYTKYANGSQYPDTGYQYLYVNDDSNPATVYYTKTFGDNSAVSWNNAQVTVGLEDGTNTLLLAAVSGVVGASVDYIYVNIIN